MCRLPRRFLEPQPAVSPDNASGGASGDGKGNGKISGMSTHVFKLEIVEGGVHFSFETSNDIILPFDSEVSPLRSLTDTEKMEIIDPDRSEDDARAIVKQQLMENGYSAEVCRSTGLLQVLFVPLFSAARRNRGEKGIG